jgi:thiamine biosynthesis protein ThiI
MENIKILPLYNVLLIRYAEIWLKSQKVKVRMLKTLMNNVKTALEREGIQYHKYQMSKDSSRVFFFFNNEDMLKAMLIILRAFGIHSISPALRTSNKRKNIIERSIEVAKDIMKPNESFAVRVKRSGDHDFTSIELASLVGKEINEKLSHLNLKVNLSNPDRKIYIEVRDEFSYVFSDIIISPWGGLPIESRKKSFVLDIGRLSDLTAGFLIMRRGSEIHPILFKMKDDPEYIERWIENWKKIGLYSPYRNFTVNVIDLLGIMNEVIPLLDNKLLTCSICRILRFVSIQWLKENLHIPIFQNIRAIVDGLSFNNMNDCYDEIDLNSIGLNNHFSGFPIFTPLVGFNHQEINELSKKISNQLIKFEYCQLKPQNQIFQAEEVMKEFKTLNLVALLDKALKEMIKITIPMSSRV